MGQLTLWITQLVGNSGQLGRAEEPPSDSLDAKAGARDRQRGRRLLTDKLLRVRSGQKPGWGTAKGFDLRSHARGFR